MFTKCNGFIVSGDPLVYADSATMTGQGTVSEPFGVKSTDLFVQEPLYTGTSGNSAYIGWNNETVLFQAPTLSGVTACTLSESIKNFQYLGLQPTRFFSSPTASKAGGTGPICYYNTDTLWQNTGVASDEHSFTYPCPIIYEWQWWKMGQYSANDDWTELIHISGMWVNVFTQQTSQTGTHVGLYKVVGINRKV